MLFKFGKEAIPTYRIPSNLSELLEKLVRADFLPWFYDLNTSDHSSG